MKKLLVTAFVCGLLFMGGTASAQKYSIQTNVVDWAAFFTINVEGGLSVSQHFTLNAGLRYNPWKLELPDGREFKLQQKSFYAGFRYWPWHTNSGLWISASGQFRSYSESGLWRGLREGDSGFGPCLGAGYTFMLNESLNLELGAGGWVPFYRAQGLKIHPDFLSVSFVYVF